MRTRAIAVVLLSFSLLPALAEEQLSDKQRQQLTGQYRNAAEPDITYNLFDRDGQLEVETEERPPVPLHLLKHNLLQYQDEEPFTFETHGRKPAAALTHHELRYLRVGPPVAHSFRPYAREEFMIPMRDGIRLHTIVLRPADLSAPLPFLIERTPYGIDGADSDSFHTHHPQLAQEGYIYVAQDIRGRFGSEGEFVMMRPLGHRADPKAVDESTDAYDTVAWLLAHIPQNNGRAGVLGVSYPGFLAMMAGIDPHPAVRAISPQAPMIDVWRGDDFFHNGALRETYGHDYALMMERTKDNSDVSYGKLDGYDYFLKAGSFKGAAAMSGSPELPTFRAFFEHPAYDRYWQSRNVAQWLTTVSLPTLTVGGYYDQEDMFGPQEEYQHLQAADTEHRNFLVLGPWRHGSWQATTHHIAALQYGEPIGQEYRRQIEAPFFAYYLKGKPGFDLKNTTSFQTGSNLWKRYDSFPPRGTVTSNMYLAAASSSAGAPHLDEMWEGAETGTTKWLSDPANPVPFRERPIQPTYGDGSQWYTWMVADQRFVNARPDVAKWRVPLAADLTVTGEVVADLFASTTGTDADWVVKLIDEYPQSDPDPAMRGYQLMTNAEIFRGRYRTGFDHPQPIEPGKPFEYRFSLHDIDHVFRKGHTLLVEVQSTWFPLYDRNPQSWVPSIMDAKPADYKPATESIWFDAAHPSRILLPTVGGGTMKLIGVPAQ